LLLPWSRWACNARSWVTLPFASMWKKSTSKNKARLSPARVGCSQQRIPRPSSVRPPVDPRADCSDNSSYEREEPADR
jgi:hypothetical protein